MLRTLKTPGSPRVFKFLWHSPQVVSAGKFLQPGKHVRLIHTVLVEYGLRPQLALQLAETRECILVEELATGELGNEFNTLGRQFSSEYCMTLVGSDREKLLASETLRTIVGQMRALLQPHLRSNLREAGEASHAPTLSTVDTIRKTLLYELLD